ncbi:HlyD family type I secretion periplasmic adaptor subunit [Vibrio inusitatus NBRC 102082]|uniref:Membrane fusion protein (MFP) family protein n=1 Tax=Vibrio inusitatus NBRC 102082 TaxID=1219070 RepID=A0A4Y3HYB5_9VIBR|nr:HlyD family type I secretion periplasmic adaptor subunit [Vibrio inusitatus]GEA52173.1 HlyD family type I secretion periplasmic adaptor subunit [Vibrio inusitatus NBRC 102082]
MSQEKLKNLGRTELEYVDDKTAALLLNTPSNARLLLWFVLLFFGCAIGWASWAELDKVTVGSGKVIPSSQLQVVQNLEGGLVKEILVREGQQVTQGQQLLLIDDTRFRSDFREREQQIYNLTAKVLQLSASVASIEVIENVTLRNWRNSVTISTDKLIYPANFEETQPRLAARQRAEYRQDLNNLRNQLRVLDQQVDQKIQDLNEVRGRISNLQQGYDFAQKEYELMAPLAEEGIVPQIEFIKLKRQVNDTKRELDSARGRVPVLNASIREALLSRVDAALGFRSEQQEKLNLSQDELSAITQSTIGLEDRVSRTIVTSPVTGTIKKLYTNTVGGVIQPGMDLVEIVPTEDVLVVEAEIAPQDIAFLRPGLPAIVKFSAYDFTKYGGLEGRLEHISADTIQDEEGNSFYLVRVHTEKTGFGSDGELPIIPGMTASVDIITGKRTVLDYLLKPVLSAKGRALRE